MLTVHREFPPRDVHTPDPSAEVQQLLGDASLGIATTEVSSTPPPGIPASRHSGTAGRASARPAGSVQRFSGTRTVALSVVEFPQLSVAR